MKILLVGEYSRLHLSLAEGLQSLGHQVVVASDGDGHKQYARDIDLTRKSSGLKDTIAALYQINKHFRKFKGFDIVQIINPCFLTLSIGFNKHYFDQLKRNNKKIFLGAFGVDSYWVRACVENKIFKYSEFYVDGKSTDIPFNLDLEKKWLDNSREELNQYIAEKSDGITACLYEYYKSYEPYFSDKLKYIPLPINVSDIPFQVIEEVPEKIKFFIGIDKIRTQHKGTDLMEEVLKDFVAKHPNETEILKAESVSYEEYQQYVSQSHVVLDQIYSHSPSMNPLQAMAGGKIVISGGEPEIYNLMGENVSSRPIVNVYPTREGIWQALESILANKNKLPSWSKQGRDFVEQYHDAKSVAEKYLEFWKQ